VPLDLRDRIRADAGHENHHVDPPVMSDLQNDGRLLRSSATPRIEGLTNAMPRLAIMCTSRPRRLRTTLLAIQQMMTIQPALTYSANSQHRT
jgi:hypothetical protein